MTYATDQALPPHYVPIMIHSLSSSCLYSHHLSEGPQVRDRSPSSKTRTIEFSLSVDATTSVSNVTEDPTRSSSLDALWCRRVFYVVLSVTDMMRTSSGPTKSHCATETTYTFLLSASMSCFFIPQSFTQIDIVNGQLSHFSQDKSTPLDDSKPADQ